MDGVNPDSPVAREEGLPVVRTAVADSLALDLDEVSPTSRLVTDLGADSLDFVDLIFTLEKKFGVKIRESELGLLTRLDINSPDVLQGDYLTPQAIDKLAPWVPAILEVEDLARVTPGQLFSMITVETLWNVVARKLSE